MARKQKTYRELEFDVEHLVYEDMSGELRDSLGTMWNEIYYDLFEGE